MKKILFLLAICFSFFARAQQTLADYEEVVYLKNGSVIRGIIIEEVPGVSLKIKTREDNLLVYKIDEVEKITKELFNGSGNTSIKTDTRKKKGFNAYIDQGISLWIIDKKPFPMNNTSIALGYKINRVVFVGGGIGLLARDGFVGIPFFFDGRFTFTKTKAAPLLNLQAGYISPNLVEGNDYYSPDSYGGFYFGLRPGVGFNLKKDLDLNLYTGYQLGSQIYSYSSYYGNDTEIGLMHMWNFTIGLKF